MYKKNLLFDKANPLVKSIYKTTLNLPYKYQSSIGDQLRRACLSIVLNIVEGGARKGVKERRQFNSISYSSLKETKYLLYFMNEMKLIEAEIYEKLASDCNELARILYCTIYR